jgi:hypothetical protein
VSPVSEHITRAEFYGELRKFTTWVNQIQTDLRHRMGRLEREAGTIVGELTDEVGVLEGLVAQVESALAAQADKIQALTDQVTADDNASAQAKADHQELVDGHDRLAAVVQDLRDHLSVLSPDAPAGDVVAPAPGSTTTAPADGGSGGSGMAANTPSTDPVPPGGETVTVDPTLPDGTAPTAAPPDATAGPGQGDPNPSQPVSPDQAAPVVDPSADPSADPAAPAPAEGSGGDPSAPDGTTGGQTA